MAKDKPSRQEMDQLALSLGRVVITCSMLEHDLTMTIAAILSLNEVQERTLLRPMATSAKLTLLNRIAKDFLSKADCRRVTTVTGNIKDAAERRNDLIHGLYVHSDTDSSAAILSFSGSARITGKPTPITPRELDLFRVNLVWLSDELISLRPLFPKIERAPKTPGSASNKQHSKRP